MNYSVDLLLVLGLPRSGTTWIGKIFDSHPDTLYLHEPDSAYPLTFLENAPLAKCVSVSPDVVRYLDWVRRERPMSILSKEPIFPKRYFPRAERFLHRASVYSAKLMERTSKGASVRALFVPANGESKIVWKSIESVARVVAIVNSIENSKAIHLVRHPCAVVASVMRGIASSKFRANPNVDRELQLMDSFLSCPAGKRLDFDRKDLRSMDAVQRLAWRWAVMNDHALLESEGNDRIGLAKYEDICRNPRSELKALFRFAEISWDSAVDRFVSQSTTIESGRYYGVFKSPTKVSSAWQRELDARTIANVLSIAERSRTFDALYSSMSNFRVKSRVAPPMACS